MESLGRAAEGPIDDLWESVRDQVPEDWIRLVYWVGRLQDRGNPTTANIELNRVITWSGDKVGASYISSSGTRHLIDDIMAEGADLEPEWTQMRLSIDRDNRKTLNFIQDEPRRSFDDAARDPYWRHVHDYVEHHADEVDALVERLRASGDLPGKRVKRRGPLAYFRRD